MIQILYTVLNEPIDEKQFHDYLHLLPVTMQQAVSRYKRVQDAQACLVGKLLIIKGLDRFGFDELSLSDIKYTPYKQPYFQDSLKFNISHSGNLVVCALTLDDDLGIDVEQVLPIEIDDFSSQFSHEEKSMIRRASNPTREFYQWWTKKEAVVKADGRGLAVPLKEIQFESLLEARIEFKRWFLKPIELHDDYCSHIASSTKLDQEINVEQIQF